MLAVLQTSPRRQQCCRLPISIVERDLCLLHFFKGVFTHIIHFFKGVFKSFIVYISYLQPHKNIRIRIVVESVDADKARPLI